MTSFMTMDFDKCPFMPTSRDACTSWTNAFAEDVQNAMETGMSAHLSKPIDMAVLKDVLKKLIHSTGRTERSDPEPERQ